MRSQRQNKGRTKMPQTLYTDGGIFVLPQLFLPAIGCYHLLIVLYRDMVFLENFFEKICIFKLFYKK